MTRTPRLNAEETLQLPLDQILLNLGYFKDKNKSSKNHIKLKNNNGDALVISRNAKGDYLYFNPYDESDRGNIFNFCKNRGLKVQDLLQLQKETNLQCHTLSKNTDTRDKEIEEVLAKFLTFKNLQSQNHFSSDRGISNAILQHLMNEIKMDARDNIAIPTYTIKTLQTNKPKQEQTQETERVQQIFSKTGYQLHLKNPLLKNKEGETYTKPLKQICYGKKGLEVIIFSNSKEKEERSKIAKIILTESSIDSLSLFEKLNNERLNKMNTIPNTLILSTNGTITESQLEALQYLDERFPNAKVFLGFDKDKAGEKNTQKTQECFKNAEVNVIKPYCKDFNEDLILSKVLEVDINAITEENIQQSLKDFNENLAFFNRGEEFIYEHLKQQSFQQGVQIASRIYYALNQNHLEIPQELKQSMEKNLATFNQKLLAFEEKMERNLKN
ncbi:toprim domain-containing protein [uncultured Helicobacter sp.]|uniref:toprim domain-containing protein n=1 Tax=uncultured Helicobacter sp. TaxID=175537 RepID=UPI0026079A18|nr:toprim domain-containing protein [uncultured Helicobacter sp.]